MDANTYYLNQYLAEEDAKERWGDRAERIADEQIKDPRSEYYPWSYDSILEAVGEASAGKFKKLLDSKDDFAALGEAFAEIVEGYWHRAAYEDALEDDPDAYDDRDC